MRVFLSWSGPKSNAVAELLKKYLPSLNNAIVPWLSSKEITTGARWSTEIATNLEAANVGVICVTAENQAEPWILFEAGAVSKLTTVGRAMVLRIGMKATDITGPLSQFQSVGTDRDDIWKLVVDINAAADIVVPEATLSLTFNALWSTIQTELEQIIVQPSATPPARGQDDLLQEVLALVRRQEQQSQGLMNQIVAVNERTLVTLEHQALGRRFEEERYLQDIRQLKLRESELQVQLKLAEEATREARNRATRDSHLSDPATRDMLVAVLREKGHQIPSNTWKTDVDGQPRLLVNGLSLTIQDVEREILAK